MLAQTPYCSFGYKVSASRLQPRDWSTAASTPILTGFASPSKSAGGSRVQVALRAVIHRASSTRDLTPSLWNTFRKW